MIYEYKVSVIVPVYNVEQYLTQCLESLIEQENFSDNEVILVNDGSKDESLTICQQAASEYDNIHVISQENRGVSAARNSGMDAAKGKYIMFLDADDCLDKGTIEAVYAYFEKVYDQVDVVTYPEHRFSNGKEKEPHYRYQILKKTKVYDLNSFIYIAQSRLNIAVKNTEQKIYFDTTLQSAEDQEFLARLLLPKMKIGFVNKGAYLYNMHDEGVSFAGGYVYYVADVIEKYYRKLFDSFGEKVPPYFQAVFLYDLNWKIRRDQLWPYHYTDESQKKFQDDMISLLKRCDAEVILNHPILDYYHKMYLLKLRETKIYVFPGINSIDLICENKIIEKYNVITIVVCQLRLFNKKLKILAHLKAPFFTWIEKPKLRAVIDQSNYQELELFDSTASRYKTKMKTNQFWGFYYEEKIGNFSQISFDVEIDGINYPTNFYFMPYTPYNIEKGITAAFGEGYTVSVRNNIFYAAEVKFEDLLFAYNSQCEKILKELPDLFEIFKNYDLYRRNRIWIYYDCKGVDHDNGYYQFIYDFEKEDGILRYYIYNNDEISEGLFEEKHYPFLVRFGSDEHKLLFLNADKLLTAFIEKNNVYPFSQAELQYVLNWLHMEIIYLQHGVLHASIPWKYTPEALQMDKIVVSSHFEENNFIHKYNFRPDDVILAGMARFDGIKKDRTPKNRILFAPTWRNYLITPQVDNFWKPMNSVFFSSDYCQRINNFLQSKSLALLLEKYDLYLDFKLHPIFNNAYGNFFSWETDRIRFSEATVEVSDYAIFITDFSSFLFDFVYLKRPIIYYVPDYPQVRSGMNQYRKLDLEFSDGFGPLLTDENKVISALEEIIKNGFQPESLFQERMDHFFLEEDEHRERLYQKILTECIEKSEGQVGEKWEKHINT